MSNKALTRIEITTLVLIAIIVILILTPPIQLRSQNAEAVPNVPNRVRLWGQRDGCRVYQVELRNDFMAYFVKCGADPAFRLAN